MTEPSPAPDWWDRLYGPDADTDPEKPPVPDPDPDPPPDAEARPWWSVLHPARTHTEPEPAPEPAPRDEPGVHITINQPPAPHAQDHADMRRVRIRRWLVYHGTAAGVGWLTQLGPEISEWLATLGDTAPAAGIGLCLIACIPAVWLPGLRFIPPPLHPATVWLARIPVATAALALALHAPGTVI